MNGVMKVNVTNFVRLLKYKTTYLIIYNKYKQKIYDDVVGSFLTSVIRERIAKEEIYFIQTETDAKNNDILHIHLSNFRGF